MFLIHALSMAFAMFWEILWALILGFALSGIVQAVVSKKEMSRLLPDDSVIVGQRHRLECSRIVDHSTAEP